MMKKILALSGKLLLSFIATAVVAFISMMLVLSAEIGFIYKVLIGVMFIAFNLIIGFSSGRNAGEEHSKGGVFKPYIGFTAGIISMLPAVILTVIYMALTFHGWEKAASSLPEGVYVILYLIFLAYSPLLSSLVSFNPALSIDLAQPAITYLTNITMPNAVFAPLFFVPVIAYTCAAGFGYLAGDKEQKQLREAIKNVKKQKNLK